MPAQGRFSPLNQRPKLADASERQLELARDAIAYISPRPDFSPHPLTIRAASHMNDLVERAAGWCQPNGNSPPLWRTKPKPNLALAQDCPPLGQCGRASLPVGFPADEMALLLEMVVD